MDNREKIIDGINKILEETDQYDGVLWDALALLKEQKAKPVITTTKDFMGISVAIRHNCPSCGNGLYGASEKTNYCSFCGQKLDWERKGW